MFLEAGLERVDDDPAVLSVRGRLLKDRALAAEGAERRRLYLESADAYARAGEIGGATYPLINAATLSLLAGRREQAQAFARQVLERLAQYGDEPETPYYRAATRAEALLLLGELAKARKDFAAAIALAPRAFEDHASTLRQFGLILDALGKDKSWLDASRPPRSLHFAGHMALAAKDDAIARQIRAAIKRERIGFGYGALAAGADIVIAEALLEHGAELNLILPAPRARFRQASVVRFGGDWAERFDRIVDAAHTVRAIDCGVDPASPLAIRLAAEVAMGSAVMQADRLTSEAVQLLILDGKIQSGRARSGSGWIGALWKKGGRRQHVLAAPRVRSARAERAAMRKSDTQTRLAAMLRIDLSRAVAQGRAADALQRLARTLASGPKPSFAPRWTGEAVAVAFDSAASASRAALSAAAALDETMLARIAGHYAIAERGSDPFGGEAILTGPATALPGQIVLSTPSGAIHVSEDFAAALHAGAAKGRPRTELVGELAAGEIDNPFRLYSLKR